MDIPVSEAKAQLTELVRRVEAGEEIVLTRHGKQVAKLSALKPRPDRAQRRAVLEAIMADARKALPGPSAARSADFLYDDDGMPA